MNRVYALTVAGACNLILAIGMGVSFIFGLVSEPLGNGLVLSDQTAADLVYQIGSLNHFSTTQWIVLPSFAASNELDHYQTVKHVDQMLIGKGWTETELRTENDYILKDCSNCHGSP